MKKRTIYWVRGLIFTLLVSVFGAANCTAITLDEIDLMLRAGFSSETIMQEELGSGRVYGTFDAKREREFKLMGASPALIEALKSGKYAASEEETKQFNQRQVAVVESQREAAQQRQREEIEQTKIAQRAARQLATARQQAAAQAEANLNQRVINVLSTPIGEFGTPSADQQRVYTRAKATALDQVPVEMSTTVHGDRIDANDLKRRQLYQQLISDEAFVRETLK
jgi:uncharacterized protein YaiL (DUF2058 family)